MRLLLRQVKVVHPQSAYHHQTVDVFIENGHIAAIAPQLDAINADEEWSVAGLHLSAGWVDVGAYSGDPGLEYKEDLDSLAATAARGGFTHILPAPNTKPAIQSKADVRYVLNRTAGQLVAFHPIGALTRDNAGLELAELYDMHHTGAVAFGDGYHSIQHNGVMLRALQYVKAFGGWVMHQPLDGQIAADGYAHEGEQSTLVGMKGIPAMAESMMVQRDLNLLAYADSKLYLSNISTAESVALIRAAKARGLNVVASVNPMSLYYTDAQLHDFDTDFRVHPPLRDEAHREALLEGLADGTIDFLVSNHRPQDTESKRLEFMYAKDGVIMLETAFALSRMASAESVPLDRLVEAWAYRPRAVFGLPAVSLEVGALADFTLFLPDAEWPYHETDILSKSRNTPLKNQYLTGQVFGVIRGTQMQRVG